MLAYSSPTQLQTDSLIGPVSSAAGLDSWMSSVSSARPDKNVLRVMQWRFSEYWVHGEMEGWPGHFARGTFPCAALANKVSLT